MNKLKVDMPGLIAAFEDASWETNYYLDLKTGEVIMLIDEELGYVDEPPDWPLPEWQQEAVKRAEEIWLDGGERYLRVPDADSREGYGDMEDFIATVEDDHLRELLWVAIQGRGAFRRFKDVLHGYPRERERWFSFGDTRCGAVCWIGSSPKVLSRSSRSVKSLKRGSRKFPQIVIYA